MYTHTHTRKDTYYSLKTFMYSQGRLVVSNRLCIIETKLHDFF